MFLHLSVILFTGKGCVFHHAMGQGVSAQGDLPGGMSVRHPTEADISPCTQKQTPPPPQIQRKTTSRDPHPAADTAPR